MFGDLLEAWDILVEARGTSPEQQRLAYRLAKGITKKAQQGGEPAGKPPPTPGTPEHKRFRRSTLVKSLGMRMVGIKGNRPPPIPIKKGTKIAGQELAGAKDESYFGGALHLWGTSVLVDRG